MIQLSRKKINDMIDRTVGIGNTRRTGGGSGAGGGGGVSAAWIDENYVSKEFFNRLFTINGLDSNDDEVVVEPNDLETTITDIQAMVGFWTEESLSALGLNSTGGSGGASALYELLDVKPDSDVSPLRVYGLEGTSADNGKVLTYSTTYGKWIAATNGGGTGSVTSIDLSMPTGFSVAGGPITNYGTLAVSFGGTIAKNQVLASPASANGSPTWRALVASDIPDLSGTYASASDVTTLQGYFDNLGNANSANKLSVYSKTAWGRTYWTSGGVPDSIDGDIDNAGNIKIDNASKIYWKKYNTSTYLSMLTLDGSNNFIVGEAMANEGLTTYLRGRSITFQTGTGSSGNHSASMDDAGMLTVEKLKIGNIIISYDSTNSGLHIESAGIYADTYVSALDVNSQGGGGSITLNEPLNSINNAGLSAPSAGGQAIVWNGSAWTYSLNTTLIAAALTTSGAVSAYGNISSSVGNFVASAGHGFQVTGKDNTYVLLAGGGTKALSEIGGSVSVSVNNGTPIPPSSGVIGLTGLATTIKVGSTSYNASSAGLVELPAYPNVQNNHAGSDNTSTKIFLVGTYSQTTNNGDAQTYSNVNCYASGGYLYSGGSKVLTAAETGFLPLTGGTLTGVLTISPTYSSGYQDALVLHDNGTGLSEGARIRFTSGSYSTGITLGGNSDKTGLLINDTYTVYHSGNLTNVSQLNNNAGYVTSSSLGSMAYETASDYVLYSDLTDYATKTWVGQQGYLTTTPASLAVTTSLTVGGNAVWSVGDFTLKSYTSQQDLGWVSDTADAKKVVTSNALAYWNGKYDSGTNHSNLAYCNQGAFGSMATKNASDYVQDTSGYAYINNRLVVSGGSTIAAPSETLYVNGTGRFNNVLECAGYFCVRRFFGDSNQYLKIDVEDVRTYFYGYDSDGGMNFTFQSNGTTLLELVGFGDKRIDAYGKVKIMPPNASGPQDGLVLHDSGSGGYEAVRIRWTSASYTTGCYLVGMPDTNRLIFNGYEVYNTGNLTNVSQLTNDAGYLTSGDVVTITGSQSITGAKTFTSLLTATGNAYLSKGCKFASVCIECDSSGNYSSSRTGEINRYNGTLHLQYDSGTANVTMCRQGFIFSASTDGGGNNLSVITTNNRSLRIELGSASINPYISKPWNEGSDIRRKDIIANVSASIESIADAPIFNFRYKGDLAECVNLGTSAQYWRNVFPCGVTEMGDGYLAMSYGSIALAAAVVTARKVQNHEDRIKELEAENRELRKEIELLKAA